MTKAKFEAALERCHNAMTNDEQVSTSDLQFIGEAMGGIALLRMNHEKMLCYLYGVYDGYKFAEGETYTALTWDDDDFVGVTE